MSIVFNRSTSLLAEPGSLASISSMTAVICCRFDGLENSWSKRTNADFADRRNYTAIAPKAQAGISIKRAPGNPPGAFAFLELTTIHQDARNQDDRGL